MSTTLAKLLSVVASLWGGSALVHGVVQTVATDLTGAAAQVDHFGAWLGGLAAALLTAYYHFFPQSS